LGEEAGGQTKELESQKGWRTWGSEDGEGSRAMGYGLQELNRQVSLEPPEGTSPTILRLQFSETWAPHLTIRL
jgi:hypothetical protein